MQYGNSARRPKLSGAGGRFKSYYVVWKLLNKDNCALLENTFKSYYVVWKLIDDYTHTIEFDAFKSYYVVWKHNVKCEANNKLHGLNRTMQYGNY